MDRKATTIDSALAVRWLVYGMLAGLMGLIAGAAASGEEFFHYVFTAEWCHPCQRQKPGLEQLVREGYQFNERDVDQYPSLYAKYKEPGNVQLPMFVAVDSSDRVRGRAYGLQTIEALRAMWRPTAQADRGTPQAASQPSVTARGYVARITVEDAPGTFSNGSGVLVDVDEQGRGVVLTNAHVVADRQGAVHVALGKSTTFHRATVLDVDTQWDLAALAVPNVSARPVSIADTPPTLGETVTIAGWGSGTYREASGAVGAYWSPTEDSPSELLGVQVVARQGDSGGPMLNTSGKLCGVLSRGNRSTAGCHCGPIRRFMARLRSRLHPRMVPVQPQPRVAPPQQPWRPANPQPNAPQAPPAETSPRTFEAEPDQPSSEDTSSIAQGGEPHGSRDSLPGPSTDELQPPVVEPGTLTPAPPPARPGIVSRVKDRVVHAAEDKIQSAGTAGLTALLVSAGLPAGIAAVVAGGAVWFIMRRGKKRLQERLEGSQSRVSDMISGLRPRVVERTSLHLQPVPVTNQDHNLLLEAMRREVAAEPKIAPFVERMLTTFQQLRGESVGTDPAQHHIPAGSVLGWKDRK